MFKPQVEPRAVRRVVSLQKVWTFYDVVDLFYTITNSKKFLPKVMPDREETLSVGRKEDEQEFKE